MQRVTRVFLIASALAFAVVGEFPAGAATINRIEQILTKPQVAYIARRRPEIISPPGDAYHFTFKEVPGYREVSVYYLMEKVTEDGQTVRRLLAVPSAVRYVLHTNDAGEIRKHIGKRDFPNVMRQLLAARKPGGPKVTVRIQRTLFDIGGTDPDAFFKNREKYYNYDEGLPIFGAWPAGFRKSSGRFTVSIEHATIALRGTDEIKVIEGKQFFGYTFPVLGEILTDRQKAKLSEHVKRSNVRVGSAPYLLHDVKDLGDVTLHYLAVGGKLLPYPTVMVSKVVMSAKQMAKDPTVLRKYLAREGVEYLMRQIEEGKRTGRRFRAVEILRMHFDIVTKTEAGAKAVHDEFKKNVRKYARRGMLIRPEAWPHKFLRPDGIFDVENAAVRVEWRVRKP